jgi:hypothetical protein
MVRGSLTEKVEERDMEGTTPSCSPNSLTHAHNACSGLNFCIAGLLLGTGCKDRFVLEKKIRN